MDEMWIVFGVFVSVMIGVSSSVILDVYNEYTYPECVSSINIFNPINCETIKNCIVDNKLPSYRIADAKKLFERVCLGEKIYVPNA